MQNFVLDDKDNHKPLYLRIYRKLVRMIHDGVLQDGEKLPSKRTLAENLSVSVNTVDSAYQMLVAEGYVAPREKSGYYVCRLDRLPAAQESRPPVPPPAAEKQWRHSFRTGGTDTALFPIKTWTRLARDVMQEGPALLNHGDRQGDAELREAIASYLREYRGVVCDASQIVIGAGIEYLVGLLSALFRSSIFAVENPGYARVHRVFLNHGAEVRTVPVDNRGLQVEALAQTDANVVYVTPSHQFPTGASMPMSRRTALLSWASANADRFIIEDDYDSEFRFDTKPVPALQGIDTTDSVVYLTTFSRSLAPSIRIACMVLPRRLMPLYREMFADYSSTVSRLEQHTLARFINKGSFSRHLNRMRHTYRGRRDLLVNALYDAFGEENITVKGSHTGLHMLLQLHNAPPDAELVRIAAEAGIRVLSLGDYTAPDTPANAVERGLVLGFASMDEETIKNAVTALYEALAPYINNEVIQ